MPGSRKSPTKLQTKHGKAKERRKPRTTHVPTKIVIVAATRSNDANPYRDLTPEQRWQRVVRLYAEMLKRLEK